MLEVEADTADKELETDEAREDRATAEALSETVTGAASDGEEEIREDRPDIVEEADTIMPISKGELEEAERAVSPPLESGNSGEYDNLDDSWLLKKEEWKKNRKKQEQDQDQYDDDVSMRQERNCKRKKPAETVENCS